MRTLSRALATFFGLGLFPVAPGTLASAAAVILYKIALHDLAGPLYALLIVLLFLAGVAVSGAHAAALGQHDPGRIVIDEVCGQLFALSLLPATWMALAVSFVLFRFFDILKPWPIRKLERLPGGWGIMADDIAAGLAAAAIARLALIWI